MAIDPGRTAVGGRRRHAGAGSRDGAMFSEQRSERVVRAVLFADMRGFSKLADEQYVRFDETVMAALARVLEQATAWWSVNTWATPSPSFSTTSWRRQTARSGSRRRWLPWDLRSAGLPEHLALRLGAHLGPVQPSFDPVRGVPTFTGSHVSRTARIEPVTPPGAIYVTSAFAAALLLGGRDELACDSWVTCRSQRLGPAPDVPAAPPLVRKEGVHVRGEPAVVLEEEAVGRVPGSS